MGTLGDAMVLHFQLHGGETVTAVVQDKAGVPVPVEELPPGEYVVAVQDDPSLSPS